jgi:hypothetical protein
LPRVDNHQTVEQNLYDEELSLVVVLMLFLAFFIWNISMLV